MYSMAKLANINTAKLSGSNPQDEYRSITSGFIKYSPDKQSHRCTACNF